MSLAGYFNREPPARRGAHMEENEVQAPGKFEVEELDDRDLSGVAGGGEAEPIGYDNNNCGCNGNPPAPGTTGTNNNCGC